MKVTVRFSNRQTADGETAQTVLDALGTLQTTSNGIKLCYAEADETNATVTVSVCDNRILFIRQSEITTRLILEQNKQHLCHCKTPYGEMTFPVDTHQLSADFSAHCGTIRAHYTLVTGNETVKNEIEILVEEVPTC